ncbi:hypothetical protein Htur_0937 [Haloterrigena turkmenica DSM 5511]|uniref:Uncharacterized protein n=1 Tax=Haloterrigena turkmenica (strain ATCC 51198 / DSM 5511 / JCM 9101 / NCIMB 13204 / VKM B-1734 / 4k) TaxID=543526 RepID=D2RXZ7_HALTV|nr:hypothetical protein [Haloterrigena turkmenica]ADB59831.1 hypothetical protein Htur_0937 [Haloterrigena turkmenica DSM 5511]
MSFERFVRLNLILVPALVIGGYLLRDFIPLFLYVPAVGYCIFAGLISFTWILSQIETAGKNA